MPSALNSASELPVNTAWRMYSGHATNMNENSIGSVTPVRNEVSAAEIMIPPTSFFCAGFAVRQIASAAAGSANMKIGKNPVMNGPALGSCAKNRLMSPCRRGSCRRWTTPRIQHVVQAERDEQPVEAVDAAAHHRMRVTKSPSTGEALVEEREDQPEHDAEEEQRQRGHHRHEPAPAEERQGRGQLDPVEPLPQHRADQADDGDVGAVDSDERRQTLDCGVLQNDVARACWRLAMAAKETVCRDSEMPRMTPVSCTGKKPFGTMMYSQRVATRVPTVPEA